MRDESSLLSFSLHIIELFDSHGAPPGNELATGDEERRTEQHTNELHQVNLEVCPKAHNPKNAIQLITTALLKDQRGLFGKIGTLPHPQIQDS